MRRQDGNYFCYQLVSLNQLVGFIAWIYVGTAFFQLIHNMALLVILNKHSTDHEMGEVEEEDFMNLMPYAFMIWYAVQLGTSAVLYKGIVERNSKNLLSWIIIISIGSITQLTLSLYSMTNYEKLQLGLTIAFRIFSTGMDIFCVCNVYSLYRYYKERLWDPPVII